MVDELVDTGGGGSGWKWMDGWKQRQTDMHINIWRPLSAPSLAWVGLLGLES